MLTDRGAKIPKSYMVALAIERCSQLTVERVGSQPGAVAMTFVDGTFRDDMRKAQDFVREAVRLLRSAPDANFQTDEDAARVLWERLQERKKRQGGAR